MDGKQSCTILIVEDNEEINTLLRRILSREGYQTQSAFSGSEALLLLRQQHFDLVLLDLMLPGLSGEALLDQIRAAERTMPVIVISAKTAMEDRVGVLRAGADDFIQKPFEVDEVLARVEAQLRRYKEFAPPKEQTEVLQFGELRLDSGNIEVTLCGKPVSLTAREFEILKLLMQYPKKVFTRENLFSQIWNEEYYGEDNTVNVHISNLRGKLAKIDPDTEYIKTVWGIGFKLADH